MPHRLVLRSTIAAGLALAMAVLPLAGPAAAAPLPASPSSQQFVGLRVGAAGPSVAAVQQALLDAGVHVAGGADGSFGPATRNALLTFQSREGLPQTGEVDAATASALGLTSAPAAAAGSTAGTAVVLQQGDSGPAVRDLQQKLLDAGVYVPGGVDGDYGPGTATAVTNFQRWNGLPPTGIVDAATARALGLTGAAVTAPATGTAPATSSGAPATDPFVGLQVGSDGAAVKALQEALIAAGITVRGGADGVFGPATKVAIETFQTRRGAPATGIVTAADAAALRSGGAPEPDDQPAPDPKPEPASDGNPYVGLHVGDRGQLVKDLQQALLDAGIAVRGGADGIFGLATKAALESFQRANGLGVSGKVFPATAAKLGLGPTPASAPDPAPAPPPPAAEPTDGYVGLAVGATGPKVKDLQRALIALGLVVRGGVDGIFGNATKTALINFQRVNGIEPTGVVTARGAEILDLGGSAAAPSGIVSTPSGYQKKGEPSERVRVLQQRLIDAGITVIGGADGSFGNATAAAIRDYQERKGLTVTGTVTQQTADALGLAPSSASAPATPSQIVLARFPVQGKCYYGNTWHAPRGPNRVHEGVDIITDEGKLLYAVVDGTITKKYWDFPGALAGNGVRIAQDDGTYFTYLHLLDFAPGLEVGTKVKAGDVIGFVGNTGSSATPHLHFEIHPGGGAAVNPYPYVKAIDDCQNTTPQYQSSFGG